MVAQRLDFCVGRGFADEKSHGQCEKFGEQIMFSRNCIRSGGQAHNADPPFFWPINIAVGIGGRIERCHIALIPNSAQVKIGISYRSSMLGIILA